MTKDMINISLIILSIIAFCCCVVSMIVGNIKAKKMMRILPVNKIKEIKSQIGYNNFKVHSYVMKIRDSDTESEIEIKKKLRPIVLVTEIFFLIFVVSFMLTFVVL